MRGLDRDHRPGAPPAAAGFGPDGLPSALVLTFDNLGEASELERGTWPNNQPVLTFDNLGEASELERGTWPNNQPVGRHASAKEILPRLLHELDGLGLKATFFVEAINCELYPSELLEIVARGHELGMHGWRHESWAELSAQGEREALARGMRAFASRGIEVAGFRPPGGRLTPRSASLLREAGLRWCSPVGGGLGLRDGL